jgi:hypothetical protein
MEDNKLPNNKQSNTQFHNLVWLSREMNKNFSVSRVVKSIEDINIGIKELRSK